MTSKQDSLKLTIQSQSNGKKRQQKNTQQNRMALSTEYNSNQKVKTNIVSFFNSIEKSNDDQSSQHNLQWNLDNHDHHANLLLNNEVEDYVDALLSKSMVVTNPLDNNADVELYVDGLLSKSLGYAQSQTQSKIGKIDQVDKEIEQMIDTMFSKAYSAQIMGV